MDEAADTELMEEEILYESRTDRDVLKLTGEVRAIMETHTAAVTALEQAFKASLETLAGALMEASNVDIGPQLQRWDDESAIWDDFRAKWAATMDDAGDAAHATYDGALESHGTRTHQRLRWLKGRYLDALDTQRRAAAAEKSSLAKRETKRVKGVEKRLMETHHKAVAELASTHAREQEDAATSASELERELVLALAQLERERTQAANLRAELALFVNADGGGKDDKDDEVLKLFRRVEKTLSATGLERTEEHSRGALYHRRPDAEDVAARASARPRRAAAPAPAENDADDGDATSDDESVASTETAVGLAPDSFRLLKSEILQLRVTISSLEKKVKDADREARQQYYSAVELKQQKADAEKANADLVTKMNTMKKEHRKTAAKVGDLEHSLKNAERANAPDFASGPPRDRASRHSQRAGNSGASRRAPQKSRDLSAGAYEAQRRSRGEAPGNDGDGLGESDGDGRILSRESSPGYERSLPRSGGRLDHFPRGPSSDRSGGGGSDAGGGDLLDPAPRGRDAAYREYEEVAARLREQLQRETRTAADVTALAGALEAKLGAARSTVAKLELVVSEKNALLAEMTKLARLQREHARTSRETLDRVRLEFSKSNSAGLLVLSDKGASASARLHRAASHPHYYQHGATRLTTPMLEPVTGHLVQVGAPYRHAPLHQAPMLQTLKGRLQSTLKATATAKAFASMDRPLAKSLARTLG